MEIDKLIKKIKMSKSRKVMLETVEELANTMKEENEMLRLQLAAREKERDDYKKELDELHKSISYRFGRWVAETRIGGWLKGVLRKYVWK
jgi:hypothetical protein